MTSLPPIIDSLSQRDSDDEYTAAGPVLEDYIKLVTRLKSSMKILQTENATLRNENSALKLKLVDTQRRASANFNEIPIAGSKELDVEHLRSASLLMAEEVAQLQRELLALPKLEGWLFKKASAFTLGWQKRFTLVLGFNIYYSKSAIFVKADQLAGELGITTISMENISDIERHGEDFHIHVKEAV